MNLQINYVRKLFFLSCLAFSLPVFKANQRANSNMQYKVNGTDESTEDDVTQTFVINTTQTRWQRSYQMSRNLTQLAKMWNKY